MKPACVKRWALMGLLALVLLTPGLAAAQTTFARVVVFGTSLSDPGNAFALIKQMTLPPYDTLDQFLVPNAPYGKGGHHFTNGATWVEQFARPLGLAGDTRPAFQASNLGATNYAVGGAIARDVGIDTLSAEVTAFLRDFNNTAPSDARYVVEMGANDVRDALAAFAAHGDADAIIRDALSGIDANIRRLYTAGARKFLVWKVPNIGLTPAVRILETCVPSETCVPVPGAIQAAEFLSQSFNSGLDTLVGSLAGLPGIEIVRFDAYQKLEDLVANPGAFGLRVVDRAHNARHSAL